MIVPSLRVVLHQVHLALRAHSRFPCDLVNDNSNCESVEYSDRAVTRFWSGISSFLFLLTDSLEVSRG